MHPISIKYIGRKIMLNEITKGLLNEEIKKCMEIFRGNKGGCSFNNGSSCNNCGAVSLLHKLLHGVVDHRPIRELYPEIKIKKEKKTIEYVESMKEFLTNEKILFKNLVRISLIIMV